jgi:transcriptional regulator with XRE-family HTH domain
MEKLGKKIRRLRKEADKCQKELLDNQSAVAQIENGSNLNPKRARIKEIAINLGTTIEELVKDTDWIETNVVKSSSIAVSESDFELKVFNKNRFEVIRKVYPQYDSNGVENKYCPNFGTPLVSLCKDCKKYIENQNSSYCMGCGKQLFYDFHYITRFLQTYLDRIWKNEEYRNTLCTDPYYFWIEVDEIDEDYVDILNEPNDIENYDSDYALACIKYIFGNIDKQKYYSEKSAEWTVEDFRNGSRSEVKELSDYFTQWTTKNNFIQKYAIEVDKIIENPEESNFQPNEVKPDYNENSMEED